MSDEISLLRAILQLTARQMFNEEELQKLISPKKHTKYLEAYNLCDGIRTQGEVADKMQLDSSNFSKVVGKWVSSGIAFRLGEGGKEVKILHAYPIEDLSFENS